MTLPDWWYAPPISPTEKIRLFGLTSLSPSKILGSAPVYDPKAHYEKVKAFHDSYPLKTEEQCQQLTLQLLKNVIKKRPNIDVLEAMYVTFYDVLKEEGIFEPTLLPYDPNHSSYYINEIHRPYLVEQEHYYAQRHLTLPKIEKAYAEFFETIIDALPPGAFEEPTGTTLPLFQLIPDAQILINNIIAHFAGAAQGATPANRLFYKLRDIIIRNAKIASGIDPEGDSKKPLIFASDYDGSPSEVAELYLRDTPFLNLLYIPVPWSLDQETRFSGHWIVSPPGRGKTVLLHSLFNEDIKRNASIILMDSKGDLINPIKEMKELQDRLVIIEPDTQFPLALNPLDIPRSNILRTIGLLEYFFSSLLEAKLTALQSTLFRNLLPALVECVPNPTLATFRDIITNGLKDYWQYFDNLSPLIKRFLETQFDTKTYTDTRNQLVWRLDYLMTNPLLAAVFNSPKTKFDISKEMDAGKIILINNSKELLEEDGSEFFGRFFIALVLSAAQQRSGRPQEQKLPCYFYIDECHTVIHRDERIATILDECRSQNIALIMAHQRLEQISSKDVLSALMNCAVRMANSDDDARALAPSLRTTPQFLQSLGVGQFAVWTRGMRNTSAFALDIPHVKLNERPRLSNEEKITLRDRMRREFCNPAAVNAPQQHAPKHTVPEQASEPPAKPLPPLAPKPQKSRRTSSDEPWPDAT